MYYPAEMEHLERVIMCLCVSLMLKRQTGWAIWQNASKRSIAFLFLLFLLKHLDV